MAVTMTQAAATHVQNFLTKRGKGMGFVREGLNEGFKFNNPNVKDECGCGESFTI